jgi:hypothetical protein
MKDKTFFSAINIEKVSGNSRRSPCKEGFQSLFVSGSIAPQWAPQGLLIREVSKPHKDTPQSVGLLWTSDQLVSEIST